MRLLEYVSKWTPITGRQLLESGDTFNVADWMQFQQIYDAKFQTINNGFSIASERVTIAAGATRHIALVPAEGKRVIVYERDVIADDGEFFIDILRGATFTPNTNFLTPYSLNESALSAVTSTIMDDVQGVTGGVVIEHGLLSVAWVLGNNLSASSFSQNMIIKIFTTPTVMRIQNVSDVSANVVIRVLLWEDEA